MLGFYLHILIEIPAIFGFLFSPSNTLSKPQPYASPVIRQYAVLLAVTSLILISVMIDIEHRAKINPHDPHLKILKQRIAGALAIYHVAPAIRAISRLGVGFQLPFRATFGGTLSKSEQQNVEKGPVKALFSSPLMHLALHGVCCACLIDIALERYVLF